MTRTPLPDRRESEIREIGFAGKTYLVCVSRYADGTPAEVFADGDKDGSAMQAIIDDACILISIALQHGIALAELAHSLGVVPAFTDGFEVETYASPIGMLVGSLA